MPDMIKKDDVVPVFTEPQIADMPYMPSTKIITRKIGAGSNPLQGIVSSQEVEGYLEEFRGMGFRLFNTHFLGMIEDSINVLFILVRE